MTLAILVADGNARDTRDKHEAVRGSTSARAYADVVRALAPDAACTLLYPADADETAPRGAALAEFDAVVFTGSSLHVTDRVPAVTRQLDLMRAVFAAGVPAFGSCWGVQVAACVAGGEARRNPRGPEYGFARRLAPTERGREHPLLAGRPPAYDAPTIHDDAVLTPPADATVLAGNAVLDVQAIEIRHGAGVFWGTQYHPELDLDELACLLRLGAHDVLEAGLCRDPEALRAYAADLAALHAEPDRADLAWRHGLDGEVLDASRRRREIANFLERLARPTRAQRRG